jgi:hypothetical protein
LKWWNFSSFAYCNWKIGNFAMALRHLWGAVQVRQVQKLSLYFNLGCLPEEYSWNGLFPSPMETQMVKRQRWHYN